MICAKKKGRPALLSRRNIMNYTLIPRKKQPQYRIMMRTMKKFVKNAKVRGNFLARAGKAVAAGFFQKALFFWRILLYNIV